MTVTPQAPDSRGEHTRMQTLESYVGGRWTAPIDPGKVLRHAATGEPVADISSSGVDFAAAVDYAKRVGGPALRRQNFHQRALALKALAKYLLERKAALYQLSTATGATRRDSWIDIEGGIGVLFAYSSKARRELPNTKVWVDGEPDMLSRDGSFLGLHILTPRRGVAVHINAFNFPCWGMLEKLAPTLLAGMPAIVKPASQTAYLTEAMVRDIIASEILPAGSIQLICGSAGDLLDHLGGQDVVAFTGSATTAQMLRQHPAVIANSVRFNAEADSLNAAILAPSAAPGSAEFDLFVQEVVQEMTVKAGQKCTAIRRAIVPNSLLDAVGDALTMKLERVQVGDPGIKGTDMGPLASRDQVDEVSAAIASITDAADVVLSPDRDIFGAVDHQHGAFVAPTVLRARDPRAAEVHQIEAFGPVSTLIGYDSLDDAIDLAALGGGSLVASVFASSNQESVELTLGIACHHGRVLVASQACAKTSTGHGSPLPQMVHGGPGRAGGGEELGGMRGVTHYMQRTAVQGSPDSLMAVTGRYITGASRHTDGPHPFKLHFEELQIGHSIETESRRITLEDIERFADLSGDRFYAHMDEEAAKQSPIFEGRVAHGYFVVAAAAGLFVWPDPGPVLANTGLEKLRFITPAYPGDELRVIFTCKQKSLRVGAGYGEVRWDTQVLNQNDEIVAAYDVLTMVANYEGENLDD